jgi:hypothetical protein
MPMMLLICLIFHLTPTFLSADGCWDDASPSRQKFIATLKSIAQTKEQQN